MAVVLAVVLVGLTRWVDPPGGYYLLSERMRLGVVDHRPLPLEDLGVGVARAAVAAEDARFCSHGGVDWAAVRDALDDYAQTGRLRGASTITQQTAKNVFLWHGRTMVRKGMEIPFAALMEWFWGKRRILEVYLNVAEFGEGVFGVEAAARHYYNLPAAGLSERQAARLMALLPSPKTRDPRALSSGLRKRAGRIAAGARTIAARGDDACFAATS
ncbi:MAG: monofunctional biosynthetic peptidoglycan transglycosylase [Pseudomonadota bacterium]